ncbi:MAG: AAA family ATPase [Pseudomonadota bacterium]
MILKGNSRANGHELAFHLLNAEDNEHVRVHEVRGFLAEELLGAFKEIEAIAQGTKCEQYLFSLSLSPPKSETVSVEDFETEIAAIEKRLGLAGQPRAIVFHEKLGRRHAHCVWSRIDIAKMRAINLPHYKRKLTELSREIYIRHEWEVPSGLLNPDDRSPNNFSQIEAAQSKRGKHDPVKLKKMFQACWTSSDSVTGFRAALWEQGFCLARGDRRGFVAVDADGQVYSLSRWCGVRTKELKRRLGNSAGLPDVDAALETFAHLSSATSPDLSTQRVLEAHKKSVIELVAQQKKERRTLLQTHEARRLDEIRSYQATLPTGLRAVWERLKGTYQQRVEKIARSAQNNKIRDDEETQSLISRHLAERRALDKNLEFAQAQKAFESEILGQQHSSSEPSQQQSDPRQYLVLQKETPPFSVRQLKRKPELILDYISDKHARFSRTDVMCGLAEFIDDPLELGVAADKALQSKKLAHTGEGAADDFTTLDFQAAESSLLNCSSEMARSGGFGVDAANIRWAIKCENRNLKNSVGAQLSQEQVQAIDHVLSANQMSNVVGLAGTGKSTLLSVAREAWEKQGYRVHGAALAGKAADSLESSSGIPSRTLASLEASWKNGYEQIGYGDIIVIDEAGMVGTRQLGRIAEQLHQRGCKLVLVGDPDQLQPIQAGTPFRKIIEENGAARLQEIRRQKSTWQRQASIDLAVGQTHEAMRAYKKHGAVHENQNQYGAITALVNDYMDDRKAVGEKRSRLALAHRRKDVFAINQAIRAKLTADKVSTDEILVETDHGPRAFANGDRILFTRNDHDLGVRNGMLGTVEMIGTDLLSVRLDSGTLEKPNKVTFAPSEFASIDHGFAVTIHRSQGCTVDRSFVLSSKTLSHNLSYVALTRHKQATGLYTSPDIEALGLSRLEPRKVLARKLGQSLPTRSR